MAKKKVVLIQPPLGRGMTKELFQPIFPYGLAHVATSLLNSRYDVEIFDIYAHRWNRNEVLAKIKNFDCEIIGITAMSTQYSYVKWLVQELKKVTNARIIVGGLLATYSSDIVLKNTGVDICVIGEGEITIVDLLDNMDNLGSVAGITYKNNGEIIRTERREYVQDIDSLPRPAYELFPMDIYTKTKFYVHDPSTKIFKRRLSFKTMGVLAGRGCPYNCRFCSKSFEGLRLRSVDSIIEEIKYLKENYGIEGIHFIDELLVVNRKRALELLHKLSTLKLKWDGQARVNTVDYDLLVEMKKAGCVAIGLGIESGSNEILRNMNKRITAEQSEQVLKDARKAGLHVKVQLVLAYPGENEKTIFETVDLFKRAKHPGRRFSLLLPLPGSAVYDEALKRGFIKDEEEYLTQICDGYGASRYPVFINFTQLTTGEIYRLKRKAEKAMEKNYRRHLIKDPLAYIVYLYAALMNSFYVFVRRMVKLFGDPVYYTKKLLLRIKLL
jgi:anaerobic magnesium-protoporphyrin IX monomethyl ester cyclase